MNIQRASPVNELLAKIIFLILPTIAVSYFLIFNLNVYFSILQNQAIEQTVFLAAGTIIGAVFYTLRFRFLPTITLLIIGFYAIYKRLDNYASGEFDTFLITVKFLVFAILFTLGWLLGWGFVRLRYWSVLIATTVLCGCIAVIAKAKIDTVQGLLLSFSPAVLYSVYLIFAAEQIYNFKEKSGKFWWFLTRRIVFFSILIVLLFGGVTLLMNKEIKDVVAKYGGEGKEGTNSMLQKNKDNTFNLKDYARLRSAQGRSNELLFCAHIDNKFPGTDQPNPLYLTAFYFTKFDTSTETFERDTTIPFNDLFEPDPSTIQLFSTRYDSSVIRNSLSDKFRKIVEVEIYSKQLSPNTYLAPNAGFFVQPITIEKDFREEFKTAFRAKSYVSELNSAYFVYNINKPEWRQFQEMRFNVLRQAEDYNKMDTTFMKYYTKMPVNEKFKKISNLAHQITDTAHTPVDKVLAIRNYFLSKDENGEPLYKYTDNPGEPDIPNASKLSYFMFENHKGYCAYYAGATLFMLRAIGIPSRIAVGFLTEDRSDKNKGWYWYYAKQAHAWVQVYFPGFGWLDFDTTVGNTDAHESPKPDGTPPMQPPKAWFVADGIVENIDTLKKKVTMSVKQIIFHDKDYKLELSNSINLDMKVAVIYRDSLTVPLRTIMVGDSGTVVSYADALKNIEPGTNDKGDAIIKKFPDPTPVDELYLKRKEVTKPKEKQQTNAVIKPVDYTKIIYLVCGSVILILLLIVLLPQLVLYYFIIRYKYAKAILNKPYWTYRTANYYLHILGYLRGKLTPMQYARDIIDPQLDISYTSFMNIYLKKKYAKQDLNANEQQYVNTFLPQMLTTLRHKIKFKDRVFKFMNPIRCLSFFLIPFYEEKDV